MSAVATGAALVLAAITVASPASAQAPGSRGTITVEPADDRGDARQADIAFADAVCRALGDADFLALPGSRHSRYVARISVATQLRGDVTYDPAEAPSQASAGDWAVRFQATLPSHKKDLEPLVVTTLTVQIVDRGSMQTLWSGSALTATGEAGEAGEEQAVADKLARAVIGQYPAPSRGTIAVP